jgi:signal transduction histidine kinase
MIASSRRKSVAFFISLGVALIAVTVLLYVGWVLLSWRTGILLALGVVLLALIISGVVLNTIFLVREIQRNEQHDAFINAMTHELKTPVTSIRLYLETLQTRTVEEPKRQEFYRIMLTDSERLLSTIEQVLRTGRVASSRAKPVKAPVDLNTLVQESIARARTLHAVAPEALKYAPASTITVMGDAEEIRTAISNLIDNAVKYSGRDVDVTVETSPIDRGFAEIRVTDRGPGIPKQELKQVFKRFYRVPGPIAARVKGTGLGLYIVRSVAKRHGGRVWAESQGPGRGSTFVLELPLAS